MSDISVQLKTIEDQIEKALWDLEIKDQLDQALKVYREAEGKLLALDRPADQPTYKEQQRVLAYCLMRQGNLLRQMEQPGEALALGEREITSARASRDQITLARSLMSYGTNLILSGRIELGLKHIEEARELIEQGESSDHRQMLGWYWILQADLANAGLVEKQPLEVVEITTRALDILLPLENWPGVAHAYAGRAKAHEKLGNTDEVKKDRQEQERYEKMAQQAGSAD